MVKQVTMMSCLAEAANALHVFLEFCMSVLVKQTQRIKIASSGAKLGPENGIARKTPANISGSDSPGKHQPFHIFGASHNAAVLAQPYRVSEIDELHRQYETSCDHHDL
jgi:hypothetical protein